MHTTTTKLCVSSVNPGLARGCTMVIGIIMKAGVLGVRPPEAL